ncbi:GNAT family N-acetyltransferase [Exilibacterium tricleocarpae]|uniref:GNAT family N-acetyltransferase n=1 Tax=Exilibacterium tricleocarpae TaxID=2591008 RepID=A0A545SY94_9GAMM|nr:GNAT family protein [Exilibacterium tricleocarpae]TQV69937.1 GNAT family N-acetyltransferase [Exilibacterium tricleocarpae]
MFERRIDEGLWVKLTVPQFAPELFVVVSENREFLSRWLLSMEGIDSLEDMQQQIKGELQKFSYGQGLHETIFYRDRIIGSLGYHYIDSLQNIGHVRYWLAEAFTGKGIMTRCLRDLIGIGFDYFALNKVQAEAAPENHTSRALLERSGFTEEGTIRSVEKVMGQYLDHTVYGLLHSEL